MCIPILCVSSPLMNQCQLSVNSHCQCLCLIYQFFLFSLDDIKLIFKNGSRKNHLYAQPVGLLSGFDWLYEIPYVWYRHLECLKYSLYLQDCTGECAFLKNKSLSPPTPLELQCLNL